MTHPDDKDLDEALTDLTDLLVGALQEMDPPKIYTLWGEELLGDWKRLDVKTQLAWCELDVASRAK